MELVVVKWIAFGGILFLSLLFSMLPLKFMSVIHNTMNPIVRRRYKRGLSFLSCFGGGVFLAACLLDLFPDAEENLTNVFDRMELLTPFPLVQFVVTMGFFIVFIVEQVVLSYKEGFSFRNHRRNTEHSPLLGGQGDDSAVIVPTQSTIESSHASTNYSHEDAHDDHGHDHSLLVSVHEDPSSHSNLRAIVLLMAISLHSVFEGLAIGLQQDVDQLLHLLTAVLIHKCIIALSLGMNLVHSKLKTKLIVISNIVFSVAAPIGVAIGIGVMLTPQSLTTALVQGLLEGLACGTFLYVTFFEVLPHEMNNKKDRLLKVIFILFGFGTICLALFLDTSEVRPTCFNVPV